MAGLRSRDNPHAALSDPDQVPGGGNEHDLGDAGSTGPELDLPAPRSAPAASAPAQQSSGRNLLDEMDDDEDLGGPGPSIELDTRGAAALPPRVSQPAIPAAQPSEGALSPAVRPSPAAERVSERSLPPSEAPVSERSLPPSRPLALEPSSEGLAPVSGRISAPSPTSLDVDLAEARALADYDEPPDAFWGTPLYAYRVLTRWLELRRAGAEASEDAVRAGAQADDTPSREVAHAKAVRARLFEVGIGEFDRGKAMLGAGLVVGAAAVLLFLLLFPFLYRAVVVD